MSWRQLRSEAGDWETERCDPSGWSCVHWVKCGHHGSTDTKTSLTPRGNSDTSITATRREHSHSISHSICHTSLTDRAQVMLIYIIHHPSEHFWTDKFKSWHDSFSTIQSCFLFDLCREISQACSEICWVKAALTCTQSTSSESGESALPEHVPKRIKCCWSGPSRQWRPRHAKFADPEWDQWREREAGDDEKLRRAEGGCQHCGVRGAGVGPELRPDQPLSSYQQFRGHTRHGAKVLRYLEFSRNLDTYFNQ